MTTSYQPAINYGYSDGPFTRIEFFIQDGKLLIAIPRNHAVDSKGCLVSIMRNMGSDFFHKINIIK